MASNGSVKAGKVSKISKSNVEIRMNKILDSVRSEIKPDKSVVSDADEIVESINSLLKKSGIVAECVKGGSIAKGTFLKDDYDIDLFVRYNVVYKGQDISSMTEKVLSKLCVKFKVHLNKIHGSRDYFQFRLFKGKKALDFEIIPVMMVHNLDYAFAENSTDLSPEHVVWVKKHTILNSRLEDDIRLAKQFCKANKVYGAESYINGFSGHILDILVIHFGSFVNLLSAFSKYTEKDFISNSSNLRFKPIIIDPEKKMVNPLKQLNFNKISPLIIIDPIQPGRNSAAALSLDRLLVFIDAAKKFLAKPESDFFKIKFFDIEKEILAALQDSTKKFNLKKEAITVIRLEIHGSDGSKDVVGTKALKAYESIIEQLNLYGFEVLTHDWNFKWDSDLDNGVAEAYIFTKSGISAEIMQDGPPLRFKSEYDKFVSKHNALNHKLIVRNGKVYAQVPRKFLDPKSFILDLIKQDFIRLKAKNIFVR